jgi:hypothetical protein
MLLGYCDICHSYMGYYENTEDHILEDFTYCPSFMDSGDGVLGFIICC